MLSIYNTHKMATRPPELPPMPSAAAIAAAKRAKGTGSDGEKPKSGAEGLHYGHVPDKMALLVLY